MVVCSNLVTSTWKKITIFENKFWCVGKIIVLCLAYNYLNPLGHGYLKIKFVLIDCYIKFSC